MKANTAQTGNNASTADPPRQCQVCGGAAFELAIEQGGMAYFRCRDCALVFLHPAPSDADLDALYGDSESALTSGYFTKVPSKMRRARIRARQIARQLGRHVTGQHFLDVGCSGGFVTEAARAIGFTATGIDPDAEAIAYANEHYPGSTFVHTMVEPFAIQSAGQFDVIYCSEVLEHVGDANRFIAALSDLLAPGGLLYLTTPDIGHWRRPRDLTKWDVFTPPHHCIFFSENNLRLLLARHKLELFKRRFAYKPGLKIFARKTGPAPQTGSNV